MGRRFTVDGPPIAIGYAWSMRLTLTPPEDSDWVPFPSGVALTAQVRANVPSPDILATLSIANGKLSRVSDTAVDVQIPAADTAGLPRGSVVLDLVRTDVTPPVPLHVVLTIPTIQTVTRGLG